MKHKVRKLALVLALALLLSTLALAADKATVTPANGAELGFVDSSQNNLRLTKTGLTPGGMYLVLVLKGTDTVPTESNILYINQATADEKGTVTFDNVYPSSLVDSTVYLSGTGLDGLTKMGEIDLKVMLGDVDGNQSVQVGDAALLMRYISKIETSLTSAQLAAGDIDGNGTVEIGDVALLLRYIAKLSPVLGK